MARPGLNIHEYNAYPYLNNNKVWPHELFLNSTLNDGDFKQDSIKETNKHSFISIYLYVK
jgi:hypothetical protein